MTLQTELPPFEIYKIFMLKQFEKKNSFRKRSICHRSFQYRQRLIWGWVECWYLDHVLMFSSICISYSFKSLLMLKILNWCRFWFLVLFAVYDSLAIAHKFRRKVVFAKTHRLHSFKIIFRHFYEKAVVNNGQFRYFWTVSMLCMASISEIRSCEAI